MKCFLCKKNSFKEVYQLDTKKILKCKNDGLFITEITEKNNVYGKAYFLNHPNSFNQSYFFSKLRTIQKLTAKSKPSILDIGCGWGDFEEVLEKQKVPYLGIDVNREAIKICRKKGLNCKQITLEKIIQTVDDGTLRLDNEDRSSKIDKNQSSTFHRQNPASSFHHPSSSLFDIITMFQVIEHLKNPIPTLQLAKKLLTPNGLLLITTPNNDSPLRLLFGSKWSVYSEPSHFLFLNKETLSKVLQRSGFISTQTKIDIWRFLSLRYILSRLNFPMSKVFHLTSYIPIPTDPFGDLEAIAKNT